jgi:hypothetical protein
MTADALPDDPGTLKAMLLAERARAERLEQIIKELQRHRLAAAPRRCPRTSCCLALKTSNRWRRAENPKLRQLLRPNGLMASPGAASIADRFRHTCHALRW